MTNLLSKLGKKHMACLFLEFTGVEREFSNLSSLTCQRPSNLWIYQEKTTLPSLWILNSGKVSSYFPSFLYWSGERKGDLRCIKRRQLSSKAENSQRTNLSSFGYLVLGLKLCTHLSPPEDCIVLLWIDIDRTIFCYIKRQWDLRRSYSHHLLLHRVNFAIEITMQKQQVPENIMG